MSHKKETAVVYIITKLELGGAQKVCLSLLNGIKDHQPTYLISGESGPLVNTIKDHSNIILLPSMRREVSLQGLISEIKNVWHLIGVLRTLKKKHPHIVVHTHSTKAGLVGRWAAWWAGIPKRVHTVHGYGFHNHQRWFIKWPIVFLEWLTSWITTHYVCVSSEDVKTGIRSFSGFAERHSIIRAAVDHERFIPAQTVQHADKDSYIFGTVACFKPQKNLFDLLRAFEIVHKQQPQTKLEIVGDGVLRPHIEQWIADRELRSAITLHGWQHNVAAIMKTWDAFTLTSLWEGLPCAVVEARLLKLPVLAYNTGGIHDVIIHGGTGFLYPQGHWHQMAHDMLTLSRDAKLTEQLVNYSDDLSDFAVERMVFKHQELYDSL